MIEKNTIMICGVGSVGSYLLDFLINDSDLTNIKIVLIGRNRDKLNRLKNMCDLTSTLRNKESCLREFEIESDICDLANLVDVTAILNKYHPNIIVNTSRSYSGVKYGSISKDLGYGMWAPFSYHLFEILMDARELASKCDDEYDPWIINSSLPDITIPMWIRSHANEHVKSVSKILGSGNIYHLVGRLNFLYHDNFSIVGSHRTSSVATKTGTVPESWIKIYSQNLHRVLSYSEVCARLKNVTSEKFPIEEGSFRNKMNASSNYSLIRMILGYGGINTLHSSGFCGNVGGYPITMHHFFAETFPTVDFDKFDLNELVAINEQSMKGDGISVLENGDIEFEKDLLDGCYSKFGIKLPQILHTRNKDELESYRQNLISNVLEAKI